MGQIVQRGITLVELVISIVLVGIALVATVTSIATATSRGVEPILQTRALSLAQAYLDEIIAARFDENAAVGGTPVFAGPCVINTEEGGVADRAVFDDVDDYDAFSTLTAPQLLAGGGFGEFAGFLVQVDVVCSTVGIEPGSDDLKQVILTVQMPDGDQLVFSAFRGNF